MALDAYLTKTIDTSGGAGTYRPVGPNASGGSNVAYFDLHGNGPIQGVMECGVIIPSRAATGNDEAAVVTWEFSDDSAFATFLHKSTLKTITHTFPTGNGAGLACKAAIHTSTRAKYARCTLVTTGTGTPSFGTVTAYVSTPQSQREYLGAANDN